MLEWCAKECETAAPDLKPRNGQGDKEGAFKVTTDFAYAVAGKAYLFAGKNAEAKTALKKVIDSGNYELVPASRWTENFHASGDGNEEKIFEANLVNNYDWAQMTFSGTWMEANIWGWRADHFVSGAGKVSNNPWSIRTGIDGWGGLGVPKYFADEWLANDGPESVRFKNSLIHIDDVVYGTQYGGKVEIKDENDNVIETLYGVVVDKPKPGYTIIWDDAKMDLEARKKSDQIGIKVDGLYGQSFYLAQKQAIDPYQDAMYGPGSNSRINNFVIMRYAEVLLLYAEACLNSGDAAQAKWAVNKIQERAGSKTISSEVTLDVIKKEKKFELWLEMCRWPDQVRWGDFEKSKLAGSDVPVLYDKLTRAPQGGDQDIIWENGSESNSRFYTVSTHIAKDNGLDVGFKAGKHETFPFPDISKRQNPTLNQFPGWGGSASAE